MNLENEVVAEICIRGAPVSTGISIGVPVFLISVKEKVPDFPITVGELETEIARYRQALLSSREDLKRLQNNLHAEGSSEVASIIGTHIEMLDDPLMTTDMEAKIREKLKKPEAVFYNVMAEYEKRFSKLHDGFFAQRLTDVKDLSERVLNNLRDSHKLPFQQIPKDAVIFAKELIPSDTASIQASQISAFVTESGGGTSHAALIARAKGIPYVSGIRLDDIKNVKVNSVIVDGNKGDVILNPSNATIEKYLKLKNHLAKQYTQLEKEKELPSITLDGYEIEVYSNINYAEEISSIYRYGTVGIGLFRSEYLFLQDQSLFFNENKQVEIYSHLFETAGSLPFTFRVMDLGGDKHTDGFEELSKETQSALGCRGIRFLLKRQDVFKTQLRAVLKAAKKRPISILLPLVTNIQELRMTKQILQELKSELKREKKAYAKEITIGCMLEVPSAVLMCDALAKESDFLALGTNDLIQYTLGVDRNDHWMDEAHYAAHPSVIRMIKMTLLEAKRHDKPVTICGEMASKPLFIPLLIGLGARRFSCSPRQVSTIKRMVRYLSLIDTIEIAEHVLTLSQSIEIYEFLNEKLRKIKVETL